MRRIKWSFIKWSAGLVSLYLDWRLRKRPGRSNRRALDVQAIDAIMARLFRRPRATPFTSAEQRAYQKASARAVYWHGTGKLQHTKNGTTVNVLQRLLKQDGLRPFKDVFDVKHGEMTSTSLARQRMYARIYADMHEYQGADLRQRYASPRFWAYYFIMAINLHAIAELGLWNPKVRRKQEAAWREQGKKLWTVKVTKQDGASGGQFFNEGSDIPGNYGMLIGLKQADYHVLQTAAYVARYESRIGSPIPCSSFTHFEVPADKVPEVTALLARHGHADIPVFALEQCEQLYAGKPFSELVRQ